MLSAPGVWKLVVVLLCVVAAVAAAIAVSRRLDAILRLVPSLAAIVLALGFLTARGPTAFWRHSQIGVGRLSKLDASKSAYHDIENFIRRDIFWEADGIESSVAMSNSHGLNFVVNGRCDGHTTGDAGTQIMSGLIPAALHTAPHRALVVGLGTGSTAGWLAAVPTMQQVDVVELEPAIRNVAAACTAVNHDALDNPKVHLIFGDGREVLLTNSHKYDLIASEPSNPYRAGIASLFTREYYSAVAGALNPEGFFAQWVQAYEVDVRTIQTVYATMSSVFPNIETWQTQEGDLLFVGSFQPHSIDPNVLRSRLGQEPFKSGLFHAWGVTDMEGFLAHFVADNSLARAMADRKGVLLNTDDRTILEFAFARHASDKSDFDISQLRAGAKISHSDQLKTVNGEIDWNQVEGLRVTILPSAGELVPLENLIAT
jgi:hypothetical protein